MDMEQLRLLNACDSGLKYAEQFATLQEAWDKCEKGYWMLWLAGRLAGDNQSPSRRKLVLVACECARLALPFVPPGELRPLRAIEAAEKWAEGGATLDDVRGAADAAYAAAYAANAANAANAAAYAAAYAACVADAANAAVNAAYAAAAAYLAAYADAAARGKILAQCADIVRKNYPVIPE